MLTSPAESDTGLSRHSRHSVTSQMNARIGTTSVNLGCISMPGTTGIADAKCMPRPAAAAAAAACTACQQNQRFKSVP